MAAKTINNLHAALDIGTNKVLVLIADVKNDQEIKILGIGSSPSQGLKQGMVVNIEATVDSIRKALEAAEQMAGCKVHSVYTGIAGGHIRSLNSQGIVPIRDTEVTTADIERVIDAAKAVAIPADQKILHILPQEFIIDHQGGIKEPIGMAGVRLEAKVHIVCGGVSAAQNIVKCVECCKLRVANITLQPLASSLAVLSDDEKELGVCLVDIGGGTTDIAVFVNGAICHSAVIPLAGDQVTNDIAVAFRTPTKYAESIKINFGVAWEALLDADSTIAVPGAAHHQTREITRKTLAEVVTARYEELFYLVKQNLRQHGLLDAVVAGIVLTGGAAKMAGILPLAEKVFQMPIRLGAPQQTGQSALLDNPIYATGIGLLLSSHQQQKDGCESHLGEGIKGVWDKMKSWFRGNF